MAILFVFGDTLWAWDVSIARKEMLPWPLCGKTFAWVLSGDDARVRVQEGSPLRESAQSIRHMGNSVWADLGEGSFAGKKSVSMVGGSSISTDEGWPTCLMKLSLGARRFAMW